MFKFFLKFVKARRQETPTFYEALINALAAGASISDIAHEFEVSKFTVTRWARNISAPHAAMQAVAIKRLGEMARKADSDGQGT
jgi:transposase-like protein